MKRTYRLIDGEWIEVTRREPSGDAQYHGSLWGDRGYDGMRATDGADISSRKKHRDYMQRKGLTTADDFTETWKSAEKKRAAFFNNEKDPDRRRAIERAIAEGNR